MKPYFSVLLRWVLALFFLLTLALESEAKIPHFRSHQLPQEFRNLQVQSIYQTQDNFIWLGTNNGLLRFDGLAYEYFLQDSAAENKVTALFQDKEGVLWVGYKSGRIGKLKDNRFLDFSPEEGFPKVPVTGFAQTSDSLIWFSTYGEGVYFFRKNRLYNLSTDDGLSDNFAYSVSACKQGKAWVGTDAGISVCSFRKGKKQVEVLNTKHGLPDNIVTEIVAAKDGKIWIGTESAGVCSYDPEARTFGLTSSGWPFGAVTDLVVFTDKIWAGTPRNGLIEIEPANGTSMRLQLSPKDKASRITSLATDKEQNTWVATGSPTFYSANQTITFITENNGTPIQGVQAILRSRNGTIWYSSGKGIQFVNSGGNINELKSTIAASRLAGAHVISLCEDARGNIWFGTFDEGVFQLDAATGKISQFTEQHGLANNNVLSIAAAGHKIWLATLGGVSELTAAQTGHGYVFRNYTSQHGLGSNYIYKVFADSKQRIWFATDGSGITVLENNKFRNYSFGGGSKNNIIYSVTEDRQGGIWASTPGAGILHYDGHKFAPYNPKNKLRDLGITSLIGTKAGEILIVSKAGIDVLNIATGVIQYHGHELGIQEIDPSLNAYSADAAGTIWIGVQNAIIKYSSQAEALKWPVTRINKMLVFLEEPATQNQTRFNHNQNHISFDYIGFWYHDPEEVTYQVKLEGYDREWISSKNSFITYPNLQPGTYTFMVRSSATGYFDGAEIKKFTFTISAPFYNTIWFYGLVAVAAGSILYGVMKYREQGLKETERLKKEQVEFQFQTLKSQVNPHFLFNSFNTLIAVIEEEQETAVEYVEKLSDFYRNILLHREEHLIPLRQELEMIRTYYFLQVKRYKTNFTIQTDIPETEMVWQIPPLTLQLLVENAVKHNIISRHKPLTVKIFSEAGYLVVQNNVQPKQQHEPSTGLGLQNIISRFKLLTPKPVLVEHTEQTFTVRLPLLPPST